LLVISALVFLGDIDNRHFWSYGRKRFLRRSFVYKIQFVTHSEHSPYALKNQLVIVV